jgi:hypothetical protein
MKTTSQAVKALEEKGITFDAPRLELAKKDENGVPRTTGKHICTILRDEKRIDIREYTGASSYKEVTGIRYWFNDNGVERFYDVPLFAKGTADKPHYLISAFAELNEGDKVSLEYIKKGDKGFVEVQKVGSGNTTTHEGDEIPVISLDDEEDVSPADIPF